MGMKLDALLRRSSKTTKFKTLANLALSRLTILKNQHRVRLSHASSDVIQLLNHGNQESALLRVEHVIQEQNMLDAFVMIENYCHLLIEWADELIKYNGERAGELTEAVSSLIFAASRCGKFPELQKIREIFTSRFGREFATQAVELRNNCRVNLKMIQKLSTRQASLESRLEVLRRIASENGITLHLNHDASVITKLEDVNQKQTQLEITEADLYDPDVEIVAQDLLREIAKHLEK